MQWPAASQSLQDQEAQSPLQAVGLRQYFPLDVSDRCLGEVCTRRYSAVKRGMFETIGRATQSLDRERKTATIIKCGWPIARIVVERERNQQSPLVH